MSDVLFVNVGSVGKPKDGDWRACYAILDPRAEKSVAFVRLPYDIKAVTAPIRQSELPEEFANDLEQRATV